MHLRVHILATHPAPARVSRRRTTPNTPGEARMTTTEPRTIGSTAEAAERARALLPVLKQRAAKAEELRQVPPETVQDLKDAGLLRIPNPPRFGGYEMDIDTMFQV